METITKDEIKKIARLSHIKFEENEIEELTDHVEAILRYVQRVQDVAKDISLPCQKNVNVLRDDVISKTDPEPIRAQAPEREGNYFVMPVILEGGK